MDYRAKANMEKDIDKIKKAHEKLVDGDEKLKDLISKIRGDEFDWEGKNKEAVISLLELCSQFSNKLIGASEKNQSSMDEFYNKADEYMNSSNNKIIEPWTWRL